jgi:citrate lyase alpha subunit
VAGLEYAFEAKQRARTIVELTVQNIGDGTMVKTKGLIRNVSRKSGVGQTMTISFEHHGQDSEFE